MLYIITSSRRKLNRTGKRTTLIKRLWMLGLLHEWKWKIISSASTLHQKLWPPWKRKSVKYENINYENFPTSYTYSYFDQFTSGFTIYIYLEIAGLWMSVNLITWNTVLITTWMSKIWLLKTSTVMFLVWKQPYLFMKNFQT